MVAGHRATRRQAIKAAEQGKDEKKRGAVKEEELKRVMIEEH